MNNRKVNFLIVSLSLMALVLAGCSPAGSPTSPEPVATLMPATAQASAQKTYSDPFAYCAAVGQVDKPDKRYTGPQMSDDLFKDYLMAAGLDPKVDYPDAFKKMTIWRCMDNKLYACNFGANIPCDSKANTDKIPTQAMADFCKQNQDVEFIPMSVTGHNVIYSWRCVKDVPELLDQIDKVDAAGYQSSFWHQLEPLSHGDLSTSSPAGEPAPKVTPAAAGGGAGQIVFYSNRDGGYNNIYSLGVGGSSLTRLTHDQSNAFSGPFSPDGTTLLFTGFGLTHSYVGLMNTDGSEPMDLTKQSNSDEGFPAWSPDGKRIAFTSRRDGNNEIYSMNADGSDQKRLTNNPKDDFAPAWSPDGSSLVFVSDRDNQAGVYSLYIMRSDGTAVKRLTKSSGNDYAPDWSPDGKKIAYYSFRAGQADIFVINIDGSGDTNLTNNPADDYAPRWSPDGTRIAFQTKRDGNWEIYLMDANGAGPVDLTNDPADDQLPFWKP